MRFILRPFAIIFFFVRYQCSLLFLHQKHGMRFKASYIIILITAVFITLMGNSCKKVKTQTVGGVLKFSVDTLKFDTIFTAAGSFTTGLLIYNPQDEEIVISSVKLQEGTNSYFHLNVNGFAGNNVTNLKIAPHDSMYVFATVDIDPNNKLTPFIVTDSLVATLNGRPFYLPFTAFGQNAHYIIDSALTVNAKWTKDLPYVIIWTGDTSKPRGVQINPGIQLTLQAGCRVYMHQNASMTVFGSLVSNGTKTDSVVFQGDRLDRAYFGYIGYPGEWGGLYFDSKSSGSKLTNTIIENCGNGNLGIAAAIWVAIDSVNNSASPQLSLNNCIIQNSYGYGIYSFGGTVVASNCLLNTTGQQALAIVLGGNDSFTNCTFANYGTAAVSHAANGTVAILDYFWDGNPRDPTYYATLNAVLRNCIVYGSLDSEIVCDTAHSPAGTQARVYADHCLLKMGTIREPFMQSAGTLFNRDPMFKNTANGDFHLTTGSPAIEAGTHVPGIGSDLDGTGWTDPMDIGCYKGP